MRRAFACLVLLACAALPALALEVDKAEIESAKDAPVTFVNYEGPQSRIDSLADIKGIGASLGAAIRGGAAKAGGGGRYRVVRAVDPSVKEGLDADIILLAPDAEVDHVRNLRWIIAGYLGAAWGYSEKDAYLLATFVTFYNALHRGDLAFFGSRYKKAVMAELTAANAGLSPRYTEWPGKTAIVVPLSSGAKPGALGAVDTGAVAGKDVTESLRTEPGKGVPERQAMTDLKEREAAELKASAEKQRAEIARSEADLAAEKAKAEAERAKLEADKAAAAKAAEEKAAAAPAGAAPAAGEAPAGAPSGAAAGAAPVKEEPAAAEIARREEEVKKAEEAVAAKETAIEAKKEEAAKTEEAAAAKAGEAAEERKAITSDQKEVIAAEVAAKGQAEKAGVYLLQVVDATYPFARVVFVDAEKGELIRASRLNSIRGRSVVDAGDSFLAVAGKEGGGAAVRLVRLDKASLEVVAEGSVDLFSESLVWKRGDALYAIVKGDGGAFFLARFDAELKEAARSAEKVNPFSFMGEAAGGLALQSPSGAFVVLKPDSLEKTKELKP